ARVRRGAVLRVDRRSFGRAVRLDRRVGLLVTRGVGRSAFHRLFAPARDADEARRTVSVLLAGTHLLHAQHGATGREREQSCDGETAGNVVLDSHHRRLPNTSSSRFGFGFATVGAGFAAAASFVPALGLTPTVAPFEPATGIEAWAGFAAAVDGGTTAGDTTG